MVEKDKVGQAFDNEAAVGIADEEPSEDEAPSEGVKVDAKYEDDGDMEDFTGDESVAGILEVVGHEDTHPVYWAEQAWEEGVLLVDKNIFMHKT